MAKKKFRFPVRVGVHDPSKDRVEKVDSFGRVIQHARIGTKYIPPGEVVEIEEAEGNKIIAQFGEYVEPSKRLVDDRDLPAYKVMRSPERNI